jgi:transposase
MITRVMETDLEPSRLDDPVEIGVDDVSWRRRHKYLTLVSDHRSRRIAWGADGRDTASLDACFDELGSERSEQIPAVSWTCRLPMRSR